MSLGAELQLGQVRHALPQPKTQVLVLETRELAVCLPRPPPDSPLCGTDLVLEGWPEQSSLRPLPGPSGEVKHHQVELLEVTRVIGRVSLSGVPEYVPFGHIFNFFLQVVQSYYLGKTNKGQLNFLKT